MCFIDVVQRGIRIRYRNHPPVDILVRILVEVQAVDMNSILNVTGYRVVASANFRNEVFISEKKVVYKLENVRQIEKLSR